ncbi:MAG: hypothetical protein FWH55_08890 [Oscillospiraceae bacterium]|nr:hypothetical protein [Oscillospiraceae bacterium]
MLGGILGTPGTPYASSVVTVLLLPTSRTCSTSSVTAGFSGIWIAPFSFSSNSSRVSLSDASNSGEKFSAPPVDWAVCAACAVTPLNVRHRATASAKTSNAKYVVAFEPIRFEPIFEPIRSMHKPSCKGFKVFTSLSLDLNLIYYPNLNDIEIKQ